jgi:hypothetical protein
MDLDSFTVATASGLVLLFILEFEKRCNCSFVPAAARHAGWVSYFKHEVQQDEAKVKI